MRKWILRVTLPVLAAAIVSAQGAPPPTQTQAPVQTPRPAFRAATDYVTTDVIVRDGTGKFIPDLTLKDFEVYEDGVLQTITNFVAVIGGRAMTEIAPSANIAPVGEGLILPPSRPPVDQSGRIFIIFIDDLHIQALDSVKARRVLEQIRDTLVHDGDLIGIVSTGYSSISIDLNYDYKRTRFNEAIGKVLGGGMSPQEIISANQTQDGPAGIRHNAFTAFATAYDILAQAEKVPNRRKAFIYLSAGYDFNPFTNARYKAIQDLYATPRDETARATNELSAEDINRYRNPFETGGQQFADADLVSALAELTRRARRANVTFYTVDPRGLIAGSDINVQLSIEEWRDFVETSISSLKILGDETGGFCICNTNDFKRGLQRIDNEMSDYYILGYASSNPDPMKVRRRIEIKVKRAGAQRPIYREEYTINRSKK